MANYDLSDNVNDSFVFNLTQGLAYRFRYPLTGEVESIQEINNRLIEARDAGDKAKIDAIQKEFESRLYSFVTPEGHSTPIQEALKSVNIKVMGNFNKMVKAELSVE